METPKILLLMDWESWMVVNTGLRSIVLKKLILLILEILTKKHSLQSENSLLEKTITKTNINHVSCRKWREKFENFYPKKVRQCWNFDWNLFFPRSERVGFTTAANTATATRTQNTTPDEQSSPNYFWFCIFHSYKPFFTAFFWETMPLNFSVC